MVEHKEEIAEVLELESLKQEIDTLKKEMEMLAMFKKFFQKDEHKSESELNTLKSHNRELQEEIAKLEKRYTAQKRENHKLQADNQQLTQQSLTLEQELKKAQETPLNKLQTLYARLSSSTQSGIKNSLHSDDPLTLFASGILHIEPIWEYAKYLLQEEKLEDFERLREIFYILFETYKNVEELAYQNVSVGEEFDSYEHIRDSKSQPAGAIQAIQLKGFCREGEVVKKTVVRVG